LPSVSQYLDSSHSAQYSGGGSVKAQKKQSLSAPMRVMDEETFNFQQQNLEEISRKLKDTLQRLQRYSEGEVLAIGVGATRGRTNRVMWHAIPHPGLCP